MTINSIQKEGLKGRLKRRIELPVTNFNTNQCSCERSFPAMEINIPISSKIQIILLAHVNGAIVVCSVTIGFSVKTETILKLNPILRITDFLNAYLSVTVQ